MNLLSSAESRFQLLLKIASQMGIFEAALLCLILWRVSEVDAQGDQWKTATATYSKEKDGTMSISTDGACGYGEIHTASSYGKYSAGLSTMLFNRGSACGACFEVRCVNHILWCLQGSPSVILTATDFCPPNSGLSADYGGWCNFPMARNWGQFWQCNVDLKSQPLSFEVTVSSGKTLASYNVAPANWRFGQTYEGKQFTV